MLLFCRFSSLCLEECPPFDQNTEKCPPFDQNTYILKINVVLDLMINTHLGSILRVQISISLSLAPTFSYHSRRKTITSCSATWVLFLHLGRWLRSLQVVAAVGVSCYLLWEQSKTGWTEDMRGACCPRRAWTIGPGRDPDQPDLSCSIGPESAWGPGDLDAAGRFQTRPCEVEWLLLCLLLTGTKSRASDVAGCIHRSVSYSNNPPNCPLCDEKEGWKAIAALKVLKALHQNWTQ